MDVENEFPYEYIEDDLGEIKSWEQFCGDIYLITALEPNMLLPDEYYVFPKDTAILSDTAKSYGAPLPNHPELLAVILGSTGSGSTAIHYEGLRYKIQHSIPLPEHDNDIQAVSVYGMEDTPEYFGCFPAPLDTPHGAALRYLQIINGVFAVETVQGDRMIAIAYPIWEGDLTDYTKQYGLKAFRDLTKGIYKTYGYLFFREDTGCLALFELSQSHDLPESIINRAALMNAVFQHYPEYMIHHNRNELAGYNDSTGMFYKMMGLDIELSGKEENLISLSSEAGTEYLNW